LVIVLSGCATPHVDLVWSNGKRPPNAYETFYTAAAADFGDAEMCPKIYRYAIEESCGPDFACTDWRVSYERSGCFFYAALQARNAEYCDSVASITVLPSNQSEISRSACLQAIRKGQQYQNQPIPDYYELGDMMREMGYTQEVVDSLSYHRNGFNNPVHRFYATVRQNKDFKSKVEALPAYTEPLSGKKLRPANEDELLMELVAIDDGIYKLCGKISPNAYYQYPGPSGSFQRYSLRDACFYDAASKANSSRLCEAMAPAGALPITNKWINRQGCESWIRIQKLRHLKPSRGDVLPYFPTMLGFVRALQKLGYANPYLRDARAPDWMSFYQAIQFSTDLQEREQFLKRAQALPNFTK
jgi:hypothetical protein